VPCRLGLNDLYSTYLEVQTRSKVKKTPIVKKPIACNHFLPTVSASNAIITMAMIENKINACLKLRILIRCGYRPCESCDFTT